MNWHYKKITTYVPRKALKLCMLHKIKTAGLPSYLCKKHTNQTRNSDGIKTFQCKIEAFKSSFF